jgi:hypothetical protein
MELPIAVVARRVAPRIARSPLQGFPTKYGMPSNRDKSLSTKRNFENAVGETRLHN